MSIDKELEASLKKAKLRYVTDSQKGVTRKKIGDSFKYLNINSNIVTSPKRLERIKKLSIPPAWKDVWISPSPNGYLQAIGFDEKGRKQYLYHTDWKKMSQQNKFNNVVYFGYALPEIRKKIAKDMNQDSLTKEKIIATVIWLLEHTLIRVGNDEYAEENNSFGLTTMRNRHVTVHGKNINFEFRGKSGVEASVNITHPKIAKIIRQCMELPGYEIFQYLDNDGKRHTVDSSDINNYLKKITGQDITAKDFRTWGGTILCASSLNVIGKFVDGNDEKKKVVKAVKEVSEHLHNTANVCKNYYIHPVIFESYEKNKLIPHFESSYKSYDKQKDKLEKAEFATLTLLRKYS